MSGQGVEKYFLQTKNKVGVGWKNLALALNFEAPDTKAIENQYRNDMDCCLELLQQWHTRNGNRATIDVLINALEDADLQLVVDHLRGKFPELAEVPKEEAPPAAPVGGHGGYGGQSGTQASHQTAPRNGNVIHVRQAGAAAQPSGSGGDSGHSGSGASPQIPDDIAGVLPSPPGPGGKPVVLMLNDEYGTRKGGISTIHRGMACLLVSKGAEVYSTVLEASPKDKDDAATDGVKLILPKTDEDDTDPNLKWLTKHHLTYYPPDKLPSKVDFIIGHVNITSRAARKIKKQRIPDAKVVQVTHVIPEDVARFKSEEKELSIEDEKASILEDLQDADVIVSVGPRLFDYYKNETREEDCHLEFLPQPSTIFTDMDVKYLKTKTKVVLTIGRVKGVERLKGYDLTAKTMGKVMKVQPDTKWRARGIRREDFSESKEIIQANTRKLEFVPFTPLKYGTQEDLSRDMKQAHVVLMPSRAEPFGLVGLEAIAAGVPVLISQKSGLAWFLRKDPDFERPIVKIDDDDDKAVETLAERIITILDDGEREFKAARRLKERLLGSKYWDASHREFLKIFRL